MIEETLLGPDPTRTATVLLLVLARTLPLAFLAPWLGVRGTASYVRVSAGVVLALALLPLARQSAIDVPTTWLPLTLALAREGFVGATFAVAVSAPLYAMRWSGELIDRWRGSRADSTARDMGSPLGQLHLAAAVVLFVVLGGHRLAIAAFAEGFVHVPAGAVADAATLSTFGLGAARIVADALALTVAFLAPAAVAFVVVELALGIAGRVAPAVISWMDAMPLRAALGVAVALLSLSALLPRLGPVFARSIDAASDLLRDL
ncbi:MAG: flagellar biosynthetic protein FliR [Sandaracinaceae bacterium]|nr:flagellar biosynthetic protein FliR [Sandaracinaceae bacterium]